MKQFKNSVYLLFKSRLIYMILIPTIIICTILIMFFRDGFDVIDIGLYSPIHLSRGFRWLRIPSNQENPALIRSSFAFVGALPIFVIIYGVSAARFFKKSSTWLLSRAHGPSTFKSEITHVIVTGLLMILVVIIAQILMLFSALLITKKDLIDLFPLLLSAVVPCTLVNLLLLSLLLMSMASYQLFRNVTTASIVVFASLLESSALYNPSVPTGYLSYYFDETLFQIGPYFNVAGGMGYVLLNPLQIFQYALSSIILFLFLYFICYYFRGTYETS